MPKNGNTIPINKRRILKNMVLLVSADTTCNVSKKELKYIPIYDNTQLYRQSPGSLKDLSLYRYHRALEDLENSKSLLETGKYKLSLNRSYYSVFHSMRAVNVLDEFDSSKLLRKAGTW